MKCFRAGPSLVVVALGDITKARVDAIVNPANSLMIMGGGVAGAIRRAGGEEIEAEARRLAPVPVGKAVTTTAGKLPARAVIHAPTMERPAMSIGPENAYRAARAALEEASLRGFRSVALPALGAGVGGLSVEESARQIARAILDSEARPDTIVLVARNNDAYESIAGVIASVIGGEEPCPEGLTLFQ